MIALFHVRGYKFITFLFTTVRCYSHKIEEADEVFKFQKATKRNERGASLFRKNSRFEFLAMEIFIGERNSIFQNFREKENSRVISKALVSYFITSYPTRAHGIIVM